MNRFSPLVSQRYSRVFFVSWRHRSSLETRPYLDDVQGKREERRGGVSLGLVQVPRRRHRKKNARQDVRRRNLFCRSFASLF